jgi:hypothetical protein
MSWGTCYSGSHNTHFNYPPIMSDGRNWTSWQPESVTNNRIQNQEGLKTNWQYRQYLQQNAQKIMKMNTMGSCADIGLDPHSNTDRTPSSNVPHMFNGLFDTSTPGFGYSNSDLKNPYLSREQLNARMISPSINLNLK